MMTLFRTWLCAALAFTLSACTGASHIPPPWEIPGAVIGTTIGNAKYEAKRKKVKTTLTENYAEILRELSTTQGPYFTRACELARVPPQDVSKVYAEIKSNPDIYLNGSPDQNIESMTVAIMVHGD